MSKHQMPKGFKNQTQDIVGYWDEEKNDQLNWIPRTVKLFDDNLDKSKPAILIIGELTAECGLKVKEDGDMEKTTGAAGDVIGVYYKPGMRSLMNLCDAKVCMWQEGERNIGKPSPMKLYEIGSPGPNKKFVVIVDEREHSAHVKTPFAGPRRVQRDNAGADDGNEDFGF